LSSKLPKIQKILKKKNVFVHTAKCLKAKNNNHIVFLIHQKTMF
jgi:hypothetical protein